MIEITKTKLSGVVVVKNRVFEDERGFFMETYNKDNFEAVGLPGNFVQDNHSQSTKGVVRGLHYQYPQWQGKLVRALRGSIFDVAVDLRPDSATRGEWFGLELSEDNHLQLYIPPGFAHGFATLSEVADISYKCTSAYKAQDDAGVFWNDPEIGIEWPVDEPIVSEKDRNAPLLRDVVISS